jgi:hypothetical protein
MIGTVDSQRVEISIRMLREHLDDVAVEPLIVALQALAESPQDPALINRLEEVFAELNILQGAVLTYAPYVSILLSDGPFGDP